MILYEVWSWTYIVFSLSFGMRNFKLLAYQTNGRHSLEPETVNFPAFLL